MRLLHLRKYSQSSLADKVFDVVETANETPGTWASNAAPSTAAVRGCANLYANAFPSRFLQCPIKEGSMREANWSSFVTSNHHLGTPCDTCPCDGITCLPTKILSFVSVLIVKKHEACQEPKADKSTYTYHAGLYIVAVARKGGKYRAMLVWQGTAWHAAVLLHGPRMQ